MANMLIIVFASVLFGHLPLFENSNLSSSSSVQFSMREIYLTCLTEITNFVCQIGRLGWHPEAKRGLGLLLTH